MRPSLGLGILCALSCPAFAQDAPTFASERLRSKIGVLPLTPGEFRALTFDEFSPSASASAGKNIRSLFEHKADGAWKTFQDEIISFEHPADPLLRISAIETGEEFEIVGGAVGNTDRSFKRAYRLTVGPNLPYLAIFVQETDRFDDGICLCGPIVHEQFLTDAGTLLKFSYLPSGAVKKVEALGAKHRAIALEWTHTAITQEAFARIGRSLRLRQPSTKTREQWMAKFEADDPPVPHWPRSHSQLHRRLAWMESQMTPQAVRTLLGSPVKISPEWDDFEERLHLPDGQKWIFTSRVPYREGHFVQFGDDRAEADELDPEPRSARWVEKLFHFEDRPPIPGLDDEKPKPKPSPEAAKEAADAFLQRADERNGEQWSRWCSVMAAAFLAKAGDPRVLARVEETFLDLNRDQGGAIKLLCAAHSSRLVELTLSRAQLIAEQGNAAPASPRLGELRLLLSAVDEVDPEAAERFLHSALDSPIAAVRKHALEAVPHVFGPEAGLQIHSAMLDDPDATIRLQAADRSGWHAAELADLSTIEAHITQETDPQTAEALRGLYRFVQQNADK